MIVFFDGVCGLCNSAVDFLMARDRRGVLQFAPLQGSTAALRLPVEDAQDLNSIVIVDGAKIYRKSTGVLHALIAIGGGWELLARIAFVFPRVVRDFVYDLIAAHRYAWFGKRDACRMPTPEERTRFLD